MDTTKFNSTAGLPCNACPWSDPNHKALCKVGLNESPNHYLLDSPPAVTADNADVVQQSSILHALLFGNTVCNPEIGLVASGTML
jgi:hypothetical protein